MVTSSHGWGYSKLGIELKSFNPIYSTDARCFKDDVKNDMNEHMNTLKSRTVNTCYVLTHVKQFYIHHLFSVGTGVNTKGTDNNLVRCC